MEDLSVFGTIIIKGHLFQGLADLFLRRHAQLPRIDAKDWSTGADWPTLDRRKACRSLTGSDSGVVWTATSTRGFVFVRFGASAVESTRHWLRDVLTTDGTIEREFGKRYLFCLQDH